MKNLSDLIKEAWYKVEDNDVDDELMLDKPGTIVEPDVRQSIKKYLDAMHMSRKSAQKKKKVNEAIVVVTTNTVSAAPPAEVAFQNMVTEWSNAPHAELAVVLAVLRAHAMLLQTAHWSTRGDTFYGDHLLFERLYGAVNSEIDMVAEKAVGMGSSNLVNAPLQLKQMYKIMCMYDTTAGTIPQPSDWARKCYAAEQHIIGLIDQAIESLQNSGCLTKGVDNMLVGMLDAHENNCYLLKQRII